MFTKESFKKPKVWIFLIFVLTCITVTFVMLFGLISKPYTTKSDNMYAMIRLQRIEIGNTYEQIYTIDVDDVYYVISDDAKNYDKTKQEIYYMKYNNKTKTSEWDLLYKATLYEIRLESNRQTVTVIRFNTLPRKVTIKGEQT